MKNPLDHVTSLLAKLPSLGPRSARRIVLYLLKRRESLMIPLGRALLAAAEQIKPCSVCGNYSGSDPCSLCTNPSRDHAVICIVEDVADLWAMERSRAYKGLYHCLGGTLSVLEGVRPADLRIDTLMARVKAGAVKEVILALNATMEGQTTAHYIMDCLENTSVKVSKLAHGLPVGGELDYLDDGTLIAALHARR